MKLAKIVATLDSLSSKSAKIYTNKTPELHGKHKQIPKTKPDSMDGGSSNSVTISSAVAEPTKSFSPALTHTRFSLLDNRGPLMLHFPQIPNLWLAFKDLLNLYIKINGNFSWLRENKCKTNKGNPFPYKREIGHWNRGETTREKKG